MPRSEEEQRASRDLWKALIMAESGACLTFPLSTHTVFTA